MLWRGRDTTAFRRGTSSGGGAAIVFLAVSGNVSAAFILFARPIKTMSAVMASTALLRRSSEASSSGGSKRRTCRRNSLSGRRPSQEDHALGPVVLGLVEPRAEGPHVGWAIGICRRFPADRRFSWGTSASAEPNPGSCGSLPGCSRAGQVRVWVSDRWVDQRTAPPG